MPHGEELRFSGVTKSFGAVTAVDDLTATVSPGAVTGFLGPNGAGKTTTLRMLLGLVSPSRGTATVGGVPYRELRDPLRTVGAALEASSFHPGRTGANHLRVYARAAKITDARVDEVLGIVGLDAAAGRKVGGYSLGMRQRLGLAFALLGDPGVLVLDEPVNGLDPEGIRWMRGLLQHLAREGRTVLVSSHLLGEVQQTADDLLVIARGRLVYQGRIEELIDPDDERTVFDGPDRAALARAMGEAGIPFEVLRSGLTARHVEPVAVGRAAAAAGAVLSSLVRRGPSLEDVFLGLVDGTRTQRPTRDADDEPVRALPSGVVAVIPLSESSTGAAAEPEEQPPASPAADEPPPPPAEPVEEPPAEPVEEPPAPSRSFAVAATGVIDVVEDEGDDPPTSAETDRGSGRGSGGAGWTALLTGPVGEPAADPGPAPAPVSEPDDATEAWERLLTAGDAGDDDDVDGAGTDPDTGDAAPRAARTEPHERTWAWDDPEREERA